MEQNFLPPGNLIDHETGIGNQSAPVVDVPPAIGRGYEIPGNVHSEVMGQRHDLPTGNVVGASPEAGVLLLDAQDEGLQLPTSNVIGAGYEPVKQETPAPTREVRPRSRLQKLRAAIGHAAFSATHILAP